MNEPQPEKPVQHHQAQPAPDIDQPLPEEPPRGGAVGRVVLFVLILAAIAGAYFIGRGELPFFAAGTAGKKTMYHCPMHPTVVQDTKGSCPICGMDLVPIDGQKHEEAVAAKSDQPAEYYCPVHSTVMFDQKGTCPICGTELVPVPGTGEHSGQESTVAGLAAVSITPETRQRMGLTLGVIEKRPLSREIRTSARIAADETRLFRVTTKIEGWVEKLFVNVTGQEVKRGDPLLTIYSPELVSAQREYLIALRTQDKFTDSATGGVDLLAAARRRLQLWDISDEQIQKLEKTREVEKDMTLYAAANGIVAEKNILAGQKIMPGDSLLVIADLTKVWADADIYQSDLPYVKVGQPVEVMLPYWPDKVFQGLVTFITPTLDPSTRTVKARLVVENPERLLKPNMYANARLAYSLGVSLVIPEMAVMRTGESTYAFKDGGDGKLIPVEIKIGPRCDVSFQLLGGLSEGDRVVTSANFLVDSESSLKAALAAMAGGHKH
jgi:RND family efflux transporter MFP subunit